MTFTGESSSAYVSFDLLQKKNQRQNIFSLKGIDNGLHKIRLELWQIRSSVYLRHETMNELRTFFQRHPIFINLTRYILRRKL